jgi:hypothetical protein
MDRIDGKLQIVIGDRDLPELHRQFENMFSFGVFLDKIKYSQNVFNKGSVQQMDIKLGLCSKCGDYHKPCRCSLEAENEALRQENEMMREQLDRHIELGERLPTTKEGR